VKILFANPEPSTHGPKPKCRNAGSMSASEGIADEIYEPPETGEE